MINFQRENRQAVDRPGRTLGIDRRIFRYGNVLIQIEKITVDVFHHVGALLVRTVDAALDFQRDFRIDVRIADDVLQVPLNRVDPVFQIQQIFDRPVFIGIVDRHIHLVKTMIIGNGL